MLLGQMKARFRKGMFSTFGRHMTGWTGTNYGNVCRTVGLVVEFSHCGLQIPDLRSESWQDDE